jgi:ketosteroid isomerase-like protein
MGNYDVVEEFQRAISRGKLEVARRLIAPNLKARISTEASSKELRGAVAIDELLAALTEHDLEGARALSGTVHSSPTAFTIVTVSETSDERRWSRTLVLVIGNGKIHDATLYRFPLATSAAAPG